MNGFPWLTVAGALPLLGAIVIALIPGLPADSAEADRQARNTLAKQLPKAGAYEFDRYCSSLLRRALEESPMAA